MANIFLKPNDPRLTKVSKEILISKIPSKSIQKNIQSMLDIALGEQKDKTKPIMVGLAAPQIGILKRIILVDIKANGKGKVGDLKIFINPKIIWKSDEMEEWYEGCYSTDCVCGIVSRAIQIKITGYNQNSKKVEQTYSGYIARIFQHEIDHLDGKVFVNLIKDPQKLHWVQKNQFPEYRDQQTWKNWPNKCSFEKWNAIRKIA